MMSPEPAIRGCEWVANVSPGHGRDDQLGDLACFWRAGLASNIAALDWKRPCQPACRGDERVGIGPTCGKRPRYAALKRSARIWTGS